MPDRDDDQPTDDGERKPGELGPAGEKALEEERKARKSAAKRVEELEAALRSERFGRLKTQHDWLEEADLEGVDLDSWESRVSRLAAIAGVGQKPPEPEPELSPEAKERIQGFTKDAGGTGPAATDQLIPAGEALKRVKDGVWSEVDYKRNAELRRKTEAAKGGA